MEVVKIIMLGMTGMLLGLLLKGTRPEYSVYLSLAAGICIFMYMTGQLSYLFSSVAKLQEYLPLGKKALYPKKDQPGTDKVDGQICRHFYIG